MPGNAILSAAYSARLCSTIHLLQPVLTILVLLVLEKLAILVLMKLALLVLEKLVILVFMLMIPKIE